MMIKVSTPDRVGAGRLVRRASRRHASRQCARRRSAFWACGSREYTIPAGTRISVRLANTVSSESSRVEDPVSATLTSPLVIDGTRVLPAGSVLRGDVASVQRSGKVKGRASLGAALQHARLRAVEAYPIVARVSRVAPATKADDAKKIGIPAAGARSIGAIVGGGKGAAIGAAVGGGAGTAVVLSTPGKPVTLERGRVLDAVARAQRGRARAAHDGGVARSSATTIGELALDGLRGEPARAVRSARRPDACRRSRGTGPRSACGSCAHPSSGRAIHD